MDDSPCNPLRWTQTLAKMEKILGRTCDADATNDCTQDCAAVWGGPSVEDNCGVCGGDGSTCRDCPAGDVATPRCSVAVTTGCCVGPLAPPPPPPQDCVYSYGDCNADCMKPYLITTPPSGGGRACGQFYSLPDFAHM